MSKYFKLSFFVIFSLCFLLFIYYFNQQKQTTFIESNLISEYTKQKHSYASKYGSLIQESKSLSLFSLDCDNLNCKATLDLENKKINTNFNFERTSIYIPILSQFDGKLTNIAFK